MSWKPSRSSGCGFDNAKIREEKYRKELNTLMSDPQANIQKVSKSYYHLLISLRDQQNYFGGNYSIKFGFLIPYIWLEKMRNHKELCYKPLREFIQ
ncbi:hypothetical protein [Bacteroides sp. 14(A)]|uniref:hypothetical protein n=1 Tax=Bacteroides sp. 14(A) TaxID=1163670 RepID=UPI0004946B2C|nr:hypothetical protein [Bacteroides sp. 14(A)]